MCAATLGKWIDCRQSSGLYTFRRSEAVEDSGLSAEAIKKALRRLTLRGRLAKAKNYFYVIVPLEYSTAGSPPASWFIHDLMTAMAVPYYVGLLSAAAQHGASQQAVQEFQVLAKRYVRPIVVGRVAIRFFTSKFTADTATVGVKTPTGVMRVSTPETTVVDLVRFSKAAGQLDHVAAVIAELSPLLDAERLLAAVRLVGDVPNAQRLGYVLEQVRGPRTADLLHEWIGRRRPSRVPLRTRCRLQGGLEDHRWHLLIDRPLEIET